MRCPMPHSRRRGFLGLSSSTSSGSSSGPTLVAQPRANPSTTNWAKKYSTVPMIPLVWRPSRARWTQEVASLCRTALFTRSRTLACDRKSLYSTTIVKKLCCFLKSVTSSAVTRLPRLGPASDRNHQRKASEIIPTASTLFSTLFVLEALSGSAKEPAIDGWSSLGASSSIFESSPAPNSHTLLLYSALTSALASLTSTTISRAPLGISSSCPTHFTASPLRSRSEIFGVGRLNVSSSSPLLVAFEAILIIGGGRGGRPRPRVFWFFPAFSAFLPLFSPDLVLINSARRSSSSATKCPLHNTQSLANMTGFTPRRATHSLL
mmetsp:Transcript_86908/g.198433  ORF Transcript_86908/g.198433 Transcript_86908/m.198433 type:complete len:321 (-) Transcript_86908:1-963(-)